MSASHYRSDIDGLRAIAVLSVVLYHFGIGGLQGGFVGVDVFFVISGYLITGIIQSELARGEFTLARFYERRARRIFPALFVMLLVTMLAGLFVLLPSDLARLGQAATATVLFVSNALYFRQSGYFDDASDFNALLHTWSLGVEEQFYVGLPLLLMLVHRYRPQWLLRVIAACALLSFAACVLVQPILAKAVFFLSPFRAWELLLGSLVALGAAPQVRNGTLRAVLSVAALAALLGAIAFMRSGVDFPGWKAAIPVLATAVLLHVGAGGRTWVGGVLSWRPLVFVGLISYSLYLWHWPLLVLVSYRQGMAPLSSLQGLGLLGLSLLLAVASYRFVEQPFRRARKQGEAATRARVFAASGAGAFLLVAIGVGFAATHGVPQRVPPNVLALDQARLPVIPYKECDGKPVSMARAACRIGAEGNSKVALVWGDSWAMAWAPALDEVLKREGRAGVLALRSACAPLTRSGQPQVANVSGKQRAGAGVDPAKQTRAGLPDRRMASLDQRHRGYPLQDPSGMQGNDRIFEVAYPRTLQAIAPYVEDIVVVGPVPGAPAFLPYQLALVDWSGAKPPPPVSREDFVKESRNFWKVAGGTLLRAADDRPGRLVLRSSRHAAIWMPASCSIATDITSASTVRISRPSTSWHQLLLLEAAQSIRPTDMLKLRIPRLSTAVLLRRASLTYLIIWVLSPPLAYGTIWRVLAVLAMLLWLALDTLSPRSVLRKPTGPCWAQCCTCSTPSASNCWCRMRSPSISSSRSGSCCSSCWSGKANGGETAPTRSSVSGIVLLVLPSGHRLRCGGSTHAADVSHDVPASEEARENWRARASVGTATSMQWCCACPSSPTSPGLPSLEWGGSACWKRRLRLLIWGNFLLASLLVLRAGYTIALILSAFAILSVALIRSRRTLPFAISICFVCWYCWQAWRCIACCEGRLRTEYSAKCAISAALWRTSKEHGNRGGRASVFGCGSKIQCGP